MKYKAYSFDGNDYITPANNFSYSQWTLSAWINPTVPITLNAPTYGLYAILEGEHSENFIGLVGYALRIYVTTIVNFNFDSNPGWHHVSYSYDGTNLTGTVDGNTTGTITIANPLATVRQRVIGERDLNDTTHGFIGKIDDVRIYNRALSQAEITALYDSYNPGIVVSDLQKGLVGYWKFDGNAKDATPNSNHGTLYGSGGTNNLPQLTTDRKGQSNKAYNFDGTDDFVSLGNKTIWNLSVTGYTLSAWFKASSLPSNYATILRKFTGGTPGAGFHFSISTDGKISADHRTTGGDYLQLTSNTNLVDNVWHHAVLVVSLSPKTGLLFVDGKQVGSDSYNGDLIDDTNKNLTIGGVFVEGGLYYYPFPGSIDDVRIYNRALSATEITALYESYR